jgi:hypothetical protein
LTAWFGLLNVLTNFQIFQHPMRQPFVHRNLPRLLLQARESVMAHTALVCAAMA